MDLVFNQPTLQTVIERVPHADGLSAKAKADLLSAIRVFCEEVSLQPSEVPLSKIEPLGNTLNAARMGVTQGRLNNIRSLIRRAVAKTTATPARRRLDVRLTPVWAALARLAKDRGDRILLNRLFRILQILGVEPAALCPEAFDRVHRYLHETGASRPDAIYRKMVMSWNQLNGLLRSPPI